MKTKLRLGAQSVTVLSTLRDPTQLRQRQCATRQQHPFFVAHQKEGIGQPKKVQHHIKTKNGCCCLLLHIDVVLTALDPSKYFTT